MHLSTEQQRIIDSEAQHKRVMAGAGSGKTRVVVAQVGRWICQGVDPGSIAVITFTRRAADALRRRIAREYNVTLGYVGTVHGMAYLAMTLAGKPITPLTDEETDALVDYVAGISHLKSAVCPKVRKAARGENVTGMNGAQMALRITVAHYMASVGVLHVGELIGAFLQQLGSNEGLRHWVQDKMRAISWDEYQDTTEDEASLLRIIEPSLSLVVGDCRQAIYGFRGASCRHLLERPAETFHISFNYRSGSSIIDAVNALGLAGPSLVAFREDPGRLFECQPDDGEWSATATAHAVARGLKPATVLCRTNHELIQVQAALQAQELTATIASPGFDHYADPPWSDLFLVCRFIMESHCEWTRARLEALGISPSRFWTVDPYHTQAGEVLAVFSPDEARAQAGDRLLEMTVADFCVWYQRRDLECLLPAYWAQDAILMTAHAAKGLEFSNVVLHAVGQSLGRDLSDQEERNLLYVAATRAQNMLVICRGPKGVLP